MKGRAGGLRSPSQTKPGARRLLVLFWLYISNFTHLSMKTCTLPSIALLWAIAGFTSLAFPAFAQDEKLEDTRLTYQHFPRYYYYNATRTPKFTLLFNAEVQPSRAKRQLFFEDQDEKAVPVDSRYATEVEIAEMWKEYGGNQDSPDPKRFITVLPARPLPIGQNWRLVMPQGFKSENGDRQLAGRETIGAGSIVPFLVSHSSLEREYNGEPVLGVAFSKTIDPSLDDQLDRYISLTPKPANFKMVNDRSYVSMTGDFIYGEPYKLEIRAGMVAEDGLELEKPFASVLKYTPRQGFVTLPEHSIAQPLHGEGKYQIDTGNLNGLRVRVKQLDGDALIWALRGYEAYGDQEYPPFKMVAGRVIHDEIIQPAVGIDQTERVELNWSDISPKGKPVALYLAVEGDSRDHPHLDYHRYGAQSLIQLTDIGLAWKKNSKEALAFAFSLSSGKPLPGAKLTLVDDDNATVGSYETDQNGVAKFPLTGDHNKARWLVATNGADRYASAFDPNLEYGMSTWEFNIRQQYWGEPDTRLRTYLFSDRGIYKPGETVHFKAIARLADGEQLQTPRGDEGFPAKLQVLNPLGQEMLSRDVTFTHRGTLDFSFQIPEGNMGTYRVQLDFETLLGKNAVSPEDDHYDRWANHYFEVADYRPNTFEIKLDAQSVFEPGAKISIPVTANYYRGKPLSKASLQWRADYHATNFSPEGKDFEAFVFGDSSAEVRGNDAQQLELAEDGTATVPLDFVPTDALEQPVQVSIGLDVTDINQQTISRSASMLVHSSDYYLGLKLPTGWLNTGDKFVVEALPVTRESKALDRDVAAKLIVEKQEWTTIKVEAAGGEIRHRNEWVYQPHSEQLLTLKPQPVSANLSFKEPGTYRFTLEAEENGQKIRTTGTRYIYGSGDQWWAHRDGEAIELVVEDEKVYAPGDTAKVLVRSPVLGTALVTTERAGVNSSFVVELTSKSQFVDIPISKRDAPNLFVSVVIIRGANDSPHEFKDTDYKLGYTELKVERSDTKLDVKVAVAENDIRPQDEVNVTATVVGEAGKPIAGAEVTLWAVDEGVLSLTNYETPNPGPEFHAPYPLYIKTWHSLFNVLPEDVSERYFSNKGLLIGGGGSFDMLQENARKDFRATAFWNGSLLTDENGQVTAKFKAPDNLTEYRVIAVAIGGTDQYGSGTSKMTVTKPVIVEPALPAFANVGDDLLLQAVVHNTTGQPGVFEVTLKIDEHADFLGEEFKIIPAAADPNDPQLWREKVELAAGESRGLPMPVHFTKTGTAKWTWTIEELQAQGKKRTDSIETTLEIGYPVPLLGESHHLQIQRGNEGNLLASFGKDILNGAGSIDITLSNTRMLEAVEALEYNLHYPYGCVEQTTSATLPWLTMENLKEVFPGLKIDDKDKQIAIGRGMSRLLSMQTHDGGLSYWPGTPDPTMWASSYGGLALTIGAKQGHAVPQARLDLLYSWISENLRDSETVENAGELHYRALGLYTLALGGKAEPAYHELFYKRRAQLTPETRAFLAMAILEGKNAQQRNLVPELLADLKKEPESYHWYGSSLRVATRLMAWTHFDAQSKEVDDQMDALMKLRRPHYGWGSTFTNAWPLLALSRVADLQENPDKAINASLAFGADKADVGLDAKFDSNTAKFGFDGDIRQQLLELTSNSDDKLHAHVNVKAYPAELSSEAQDQGFKIRRGYHRLNPDGTLELTDNFTIGDLVVIHLEVDIENPEEYLAIDDPLPALFEAINPAFENRANVDAPMNQWEQLPRSFEEIRNDRALFFSDNVWNAGKYRVQYLARVVAAGSVTAPPAKIEAMYEPQRRGLTATTRVTATIPERGAGKVASTTDGR